MRTIQEYRQILAKKGYYFAFQEVWKRVFRLRVIKNINVIEEYEKDRIYHYLKKYKYVLRKSQEPVIKNQEIYQNKIWVCWLQGMENAPEIVSKCYKSLQKHCVNKEIVVLTEKNISDYVCLPDYIWEKYRKKRIPNAQFSDLLRITLLSEYGGIWVDATCFFTDPIPEYVLEQPLFCFKEFLSKSVIKASNWFISAQPNNKIICQTRDLLFEYWRRERFLKHYFLFHIVFSFVIDSDRENKISWQQMPTCPNTNPHLLQAELFDNFNQQRFEQICNFSFIHKLTYKFSKEQHKLLNCKNTFYQKI
jgi:mannosyltransferase OCH1-like enzyme